MASINKTVWTALLLSCVAMVYMLLGMHYHGMALAGAMITLSLATGFVVLVVTTCVMLYALVAAVFDGGQGLYRNIHRM